MVFGICKIKPLLLQPFASLTNETGKTGPIVNKLITSNVIEIYGDKL
jgi:hypothetical protein